MDLHQRCMQTSGVGNYQIFKRKVHLFKCGRKAISNYMKSRLKEVWASLNLINIFFQNGFIENAKPGKQMRSKKKPNSLKK
jgi:hypothetical protein